jgi:hypothetical protein
MAHPTDDQFVVFDEAAATTSTQAEHAHSRTHNEPAPVMQCGCVRTGSRL